MVERTTRVVVVDDHAFYRRGLRTFLDLEDDLEVVAEAGDGPGAIEAVRRHRPHVVLMDLWLPRQSGIEVCADVLRICPSTRVLMLTSSHEEEDLFASIRAGASGYLLKDSPPDEVGRAVRAVRAGQSPIPPSMAASLLAEFANLSRGDAPGRASDLTEREREVLTLVARGRKNRQIAAELYISENTVKNHVRNILDKLQLHSRVEAAMYAVRTHLIDPDEPAE